MKTVIRMASVAAAAVASTAAGQSSDTTPSIVSTAFGAVRVERLARLEFPWGMAFLPDGRLLVTEKPGRLRLFANGRLSEPVAGVPRVEYRDQGGLLDVAVDPAFATNHLVYLSYAERAEPQPPGLRETPEPRFLSFVDTTDNVLKGQAVARGRLEGAELRDVQVIWRQNPKMIGRGHFGGRLVFAPDGKLFITSGDRMRFDPAQDLSGNVGKVVRINPDGSVPPDNPFAGRSGSSADVWSYGHRNILGAAINPATGQLWVGEMGPQGGDEINIILPGRNYGWPLVSNGDNYDGSFIPDHQSRPQQFQAPINIWTPSVSPSGMLFYTGSRFPQWRGNALFGGLSSMALLRATLNGDKVVAVERIDLGKRIRDVIQAPDGALLLVTDDRNGELLRLTPVAQARRRQRVTPVPSANSLSLRIIA